MEKIVCRIILLLSVLSSFGQIPTDIPLTLKAQFNGQYDYTVIGNTLNAFDNWQTPPPPCEIQTQSSAILNLQPNQNIVAAYLYWSSIGDGTDNPSVQLNGSAVMPDETLVVDPQQFNFFFYNGNFKDITNLVLSSGNDFYNFSDLNLNSIISDYCVNAVYYGGWSIIVIYEDLSLPIQQVNVYDGLASVYGFEENFSTSITISSLNITDTQNARMGYLAWNGSPNLFFNESISFNGTILSNALNPADNPFNGTNSYTGDTNLWNMDLDVFDISNFIQVGDNEATITFTSLHDRIIQNVVTVIPSELPDATLSNVTINNQEPCDDRDITLDLNINNLNSFEVLPANTPWSIFALDSDGNEVFIATFFTQNNLPIDGTENQTVNITIPPSVPNTTTLVLKANTLQDGSNPTNESNILNNDITIPLTLPQTPTIAIPPADINVVNNTSINLTTNSLESLGVSNPEAYQITYHLSLTDAENNINPIANPSNFTATISPQTIFLRVESILSPTCYTSESFEISYENELPFPTDIPLELHAQFNGRYGYTVIGNTLNEFDNWQTPNPPCQMLTESSAQLSLQPSQNLVAAYLYWSGIGDGTFDSNVLLNGQPITPEETLVVDPELTNFFTYYASFRDITAQVSMLGNTTYNFSELDLNPIINGYCTNAIYYAGWSILVIYEDLNLPIQQLNVYKGLATVEGNVGSDNFSTTIAIGNLNVTDISNATMGYLAWNGSPSLFGGESISFNETILGDALNPADNPFNSTNSYTGATNLWNMDLDVFDISNLIQIGDTEAIITFTSSFFRFIQNVVTVIPSELPDATLSNVAISNQDACDDRDITLDLNINNLNSFEVLPANTPWSIFGLDSDGNEVFIATFFTQNNLPIDGTENQTVNITIPPSIPNSTTLILRANTLQDGTNPTNESNVLNNEVTVPLVLPQTPSITSAAEDISLCGSLADNTVIDLTQNNLVSLGVQHPEAYTMSYHLSDTEAQNGSNAIANPNGFVATSNPQTIFVRVESALSPSCFVTKDFEVSYTATPQIQQTLDINECLINGIEPTFDLTINNAVSMGIADPANTVISYHNTLNDAQNGINNFVGLDITNFGFTGSTTATIYVRAQNANNPNCFSIGSFQLHQYPVTVNPLQDLNAQACTSLGQEAVFNLTVNTPLALGTQNTQDFSVSYHLSENEAQNGTNAIANPEAYTSNTLTETIWLRLTLDTAPNACAALGSFTLQTEPLTAVNNVSDLSIQACVFPDEPVSFDLTENSNIALGDQNPQLFDLSYHTTEADAQNGNNAITNPSTYENTSNPQTLWLRLVRNDVLPLCYAVAPFDIEVVGTPEINFNPTPLQICASDGNGFAEFDLSQSITDISFGNPNIAVSFHDTVINAQNNTNPLPLNYTNTVAGSQTIYYRTEDTINGCSFTGTLELQVLEVPEFSTNVPALSTCAVDNNIGVFNLPDIEPLLIENADDADFGIQYFLSESDALNGTNAIVNPNGFSNTSNPQTLWLGVANSNSCYAIVSFELNVLNSTVISDNVIVNDITICSEDPTALLAAVDLGQYETLINPNALPNTQVHYYEGWDNFNLGIAIENPQNYITDLPSTTIVARIFNSETQCSSPEPIAFNINVNQLPAFSLPEVLPLCVDAQTDEPLNLSFSPPVLDTGLAGSSNTFTWLRNGEPLGFNTSSIVANVQGNYTAIVTDFGTGCSYSQTTLVEAVSPPTFEIVVLDPSFSQTTDVEVQNIIGQGNFEFRLDNGPWQSLDEGETSLLFTSVGDGTHTIRGRDLAGCGFFEVEFVVLGFPPYFTPNGDGSNDVWGIPSLGDQPNARIKIFDRYGKILAILGTQQLGWDGSYNGSPMPTNDYWFSVEFIDPKTNRPAVFKSHFTLKR